jgi:protein-export membrane protein SecD
VASSDVNSSIETLRDVIERRVNIFGVSEPVVYSQNSVFSEDQNSHKLIIELPGVSNISDAIEMIGQTPKLEFMLVNPQMKNLTQEEIASKPTSEVFIPTGLDGRLLKKSNLEFTNSSQGISGKPIVSLTFNDEGKELFAKITKEHRGELLAIFLDGNPVSIPSIKEEIKDGKAVISGNFTMEEAKTLVRNLNYGTLPLPISIESTNLIGPSLGISALKSGEKALMWSFLLIAIFLILYYRLPGVVASVSLVFYIILSFVVFKLIPITLTSAGIAGFILSVGMAVDANILIFERLKEEMKKGNNVSSSIKLGFSRAWLSIRDSNISSIITSIVLFWLGTSSIKGFALTLGVGVLISMLTAITISRTLLFAIVSDSKVDSKIKRFLFSNGFNL